MEWIYVGASRTHTAPYIENGCFASCNNNTGRPDADTNLEKIGFVSNGKILRNTLSLWPNKGTFPKLVCPRCISKVRTLLPTGID